MASSGKFPPPSSIPESFSYDVFLSFRGKDTRNNFISHLYHRLVEAGIRTFMDDPQLRQGREISMQLMRAIDESRIYIVVFSQNYASSRWCLDELVEIVDKCTYNMHPSRVLLPVFYDVQPSDVRWQEGSFQEAFRNHEAKYIDQPGLRLVERWQEALRYAASFSGFDLQFSPSGSESRLIGQIIKEVLSIVNPKKLFVAKHPVGLDSRVNHVYSLLTLESDHHVQFIGIWGMGGSGKTVIAKALYNKLLQSFDSSCFLANVRHKQTDGLVHLQEKLISRLLMWDNVKIDIVDEGIEMIRERLCRKKVLIVLDDTHELSQVDALAGHRNWFGPGSIIIITTRDQHLLTQVQVDVRYEAKELNSEESLELFSWHSFKNRFPEEPYAVIVDKIVSYSRGLPLALEVLGAFLFGRTIQEWKSEYEKLLQIPPTKIQEILKISYDGLDYQEREIFLDIACFFIGMDIDYVTEILNGCAFSAEIGMGILKDRCLLTIDLNNELRMHDLLRDMGREIIRQQCPPEPCMRSRLWSFGVAADIVIRNMGTNAIEGVNLVPPKKEEIHFNIENFEPMRKLRLLQMANVNFYGNFNHLFKNIRWISWQEYPLEYLPSSLQMENLVALDMQHSQMRSIWQENTVYKLWLITNIYSWMSRLWQGDQIQFPRHLKILNLSHSKSLTSTPDFTKIPSLVTLILEGCTSLVQIDPSVECLNSLLVLNLKGCEKITYIPYEICSLKLLGYLYLSGCSNLKELPRFLGNIESLRELYADETAITKLPSSLKVHRSLRSISLRGCSKISAKENMTSIGGLSFLSENYLRKLNLRDCKLSDEDIPEDIGWCPYLQELDLAGNSLTKLPNSFRRLFSLESLWLDNWGILQSVPNLPSNLEALVAKNIS